MIVRETRQTCAYRLRYCIAVVVMSTSIDIPDGQKSDGICTQGIVSLLKLYDIIITLTNKPELELYLRW